jgi:hypothetical protein
MKANSRLGLTKLSAGRAIAGPVSRMESGPGVATGVAPGATVRCTAGL